jgi:hypothetical protein
MRALLHTCLFCVVLTAIGVSALPSSAQESDRVTGLIMEPGWQLVQANCTACHSTQLITQNAGDRAVWLSRIRWMQDTQGLPELPGEIESGILDYLAANYGPRAVSRRPNLAADLMPANPYPN